MHSRLYLLMSISFFQCEKEKRVGGKMTIGTIVIFIPATRFESIYMFLGESLCFSSSDMMNVGLGIVC